MTQSDTVSPGNHCIFCGALATVTGIPRHSPGCVHMIDRHSFTNSERKSAVCAQLWLFKYGFRLRSGRKSKALILGSAWHELMSTWWKLKGKHTLDRWQACRATADILFADLEKDVEVGFDLHNPVKISLEVLSDMRALLGGMLRGYEACFGNDDSLTMVADELVLGHHTISVKGHAGVSMVMGKVDKILVDSYGQHWIGEHKTSSSGLDDWRSKNGYDPQAPTYAWLIKQSMGIDVVGVCYDLAFKGQPPKPEQFKVVAKGARLSKQLPAHCTAHALLTAIRFHGFDVDDVGWYNEKVTELQNRPDKFFRREFVRFQAGAVERVGLELHSEASRLRGYQRRVDNALQDWQDTHRSKDWRPKVAGVLAQVSHHYPRNASACVNQWGRRCSFIDLCRYQSIDSLDGLEQIPTKHRELIDETQCTCAASDTMFLDPTYTVKMIRGEDIVDLCMVCGKDRKPLLQPTTTAGNTTT